MRQDTQPTHDHVARLDLLLREQCKPIVGRPHLLRCHQSVREPAEAQHQQHGQNEP